MELKHLFLAYSDLMPGVLYLVATPIGNLEDITLRALRVLREADLVACEDTRQTRKLLDHYGIRKPTVSYHEHNEAMRSAELLEKLRDGTTVALVSDSGTPLISDPGYRLVSRAIECGIPVEPIPGASAILPALTASGLGTDAFHFGGFLPVRSNQRQKLLARLKDEPATLVFYEAPHRVLEALADIQEVFGPRPIVLAREITKIHQEFLRGTAAEVRRTLAARPSTKGEMTLLIARATGPLAEQTPIPEAVAAAMRAGLSRMEAMKSVAGDRGLSKSAVYRVMEEAE
jgi:16S rRNA (cytidine1402-2'-O)-methyltransferase